MTEHQEDCTGILKSMDLLQEILENQRVWEVDELSLNLYKKEIIRLKPLSYDDEQQLMEKAENGDAFAIERLVLSNLDFVIHIARKYQNLGLPLNDLISEGNIGLIKAARKVKCNGFRFKTFAVYEIRSSIFQAINKYGCSIHYPIDMLTTFRRIQKFISKFQLINGYCPTDGEIATAMNMPAKNVTDVRYIIPHEMSIDLFYEYMGDPELFELIVNDSEMIDAELSSESLSIDIKDVLGKLYVHEQEILKMFFGIGCNEMSLIEISDKFNCTRERIRQIKEKAIRKLKDGKSISLKCYL